MSNSNAPNTNDTELQRLTGVPNDVVPAKVAMIQASTRYISHTVIPENGDTSTIEVTVRTA